MPRKSDSNEKIETLLSRGVEEVIVKEHLEEALRSPKKLRVKFGIDPTATDIHLGHTVPLRKLRAFQDKGHTAVLIIGDYTARIGDPTGRSEERKPLSEEDIQNNLGNYLPQIGKIIDLSRAEIRYNSEWFLKDALSGVMQAARAGTVQQVLHRADFKKRIEEGHDISIMETLYPLLQGYDSVMVKADVELGGTDQLFNLLMGRRVQRHFNMVEQDVMTLKLLIGTDGQQKMSKSKGNYIGIDEAPDTMFGKIMALPDTLIDEYYTLCTDAGRGHDDPRKAKLELGKIIVTMYHDKDEGNKAYEEFIRVFSKKEKPSEMPEVKIEARTIALVELLVDAGAAKSKSEARRLITQGGVKVDDVKQTDPGTEIDLSKARILQAGPRKFVRVITRE